MSGAASGSGSGWGSTRGRASFFGEPTTALDDRLAIAPDGHVTAYCGKVELGTGVRTALAQIVAEELDVPLDRVHMVLGDTGRTPNDGYTAGSMTIRRGGAALREAAAEARSALLDLAATHLVAPREALMVHDGTVSVRDDPARAVTYAELIGGRRFERTITGKAPTKSAADYHIVGIPAPRVDLEAKFTGQPAYVHDLRLPGMLHARVIRPPSPSATLEALDDSALRDATASGDVRVVRRGDFLAVVAEREFAAIRAAERLRPTWRATAQFPPFADLHDALRQSPTADQVVAEHGDVAAALQHAARRLEATYFQPFQAHASAGPSCAVADFRDGALTVWCSSQGIFALRDAIAELVELPPGRVRLIHMEGAGAYGHNGADDVAADAAVLACELGRPIRVQWSRADEFAGEPKGPAMVMEAIGGLDANDTILAWEYQAWSPAHGNRPRAALDLLAGQLTRREVPTPRAFFGGGDRNAPTDYIVPNTRVTMHWLPREPLRTSSLRSLGGAANTFANESFMDELAAAAKTDPLEFRLRHLTDPRAHDVLRAAARRGDWGAPLPAGEGRGLAFARYENSEAYVAAVAHVRVNASTGAIRLLQVTVAHDCGLIIDPDGVRNQIEGNVIQAASRALKEEVRFDATGVTSLDWQTYPILTFSEVPEVVIELIDRPDEPSVGAGEPATVTTAPAIANAIYAATGARLRQIPFTPERVLAALRPAGLR